MERKILHVAFCDKFIPPFIDFVKNNFSFSEHEFFIAPGMASEKIVMSKNVIIYEGCFLKKIKQRIVQIIKMHCAGKVIIHGLFDIHLVRVLFFMPWLLKKCYWVMWGGDLYQYNTSKFSKRWFSDEFFRRIVIKYIGHLVTYIEGDVTLARKWYDARGEYCECVMYPSNIYVEREIETVEDDILNIQVGNSADPTNNHIDVLRKLLPYKDDNICIYVPLSYGDGVYANDVIEQGQAWFGDKFVPLTEFIPFERYLGLLARINIAIFNHKRQQAMGNTIMLLGLGKKIFLRSDSTQWEFLKLIGVVVGDVNVLDFSEITKSDLDKNKELIRSFFSREKYINQLRCIFS